QGHPPLVWQPGVPTPFGEQLSESRCLRTSHPDVWWLAAEHVGSSARDRSASLLADGIQVPQNRVPCFLINLRGPHYPKLTVDRKRAAQFDLSWIHSAVEASFAKLAHWHELTLFLLWDLEACSRQLAKGLLNVLVQQGTSLPVATSPGDYFRFY